MTPQKQGYPSRGQAETLAIGALTFLASRPEALGRFLSLTGIGPASLRSAAADPSFLAGLLDHLLTNEELLVDYARDAGVPPEDIARARAALDK